jgi:hypothetical protein
VGREYRGRLSADGYSSGFLPRNGGWSLDSRGKLNQTNVLAFTCAVDVRTWKITARSSEAVGFKNFYDNLKTYGIASDYSGESGFESPLNFGGSGERAGRAGRRTHGMTILQARPPHRKRLTITHVAAVGGRVGHKEAPA